MAQDLQLVRAAEIAMKAKYGGAELYGSNNQYRLDLPSGKRAVIKTGNKGQVMQRTHGNEIDARFTGVVDADLIVIAVRNGPNDPIRVFEIPGDVYRAGFGVPEENLDRRLEGRSGGRAERNGAGKG